MTGDAVQPMTPAMTNARRGAGTPKPGAGAGVTLWQLPGMWRVWCNGHAPGTRWIQPSNVAARELYDRLIAEPGCASPVVLERASGVILVACKDMRTGTPTIGGAA